MRVVDAGIQHRDRDPFSVYPGLLDGGAADVWDGFGESHLVVDHRAHLRHAGDQRNLFELRCIDADSDCIMCNVHARQLFCADAGETERDFRLLRAELAAVFRQRLHERLVRAARELLRLLDAGRRRQFGLLRSQRWTIDRDPDVHGPARALQPSVNFFDSDAGRRGASVQARIGDDPTWCRANGRALHFIASAVTAG